MAQELHLHVTVVVPDAVQVHRVVAGLVGRELTGVPGSWIAGAGLAGATGRLCAVAGDDYAEVLAAEADADAGLSVD